MMKENWNLKMSWERVRSHIKEEEQLIREKFGLPIRIYGSGEQGYGLLGGCLNRNMYRPDVVYSGKDRIEAREIWHGGGRRTRLLRKQVYKYWTFLMLAERLLESNHSEEDMILYQPAEGPHSQYPVIRSDKGSLFVEPHLVQFKEEPIPLRLKKQFKGFEGSESYNSFPSFLLIDSAVKKIPWGKQSWDPENLADEETDERMWDEFSKNIRYIIECWSRKPTEGELLKTLSSSLVYKSPYLIIAQGRMDKNARRKFRKNLSESDSEVKIIENFKVGSRDRCTELLSFL